MSLPTVESLAAEFAANNNANVNRSAFFAAVVAACKACEQENWPLSTFREFERICGTDFSAPVAFPFMACDLGILWQMGPEYFGRCSGGRILPQKLWGKYMTALNAASKKAIESQNEEDFRAYNDLEYNPMILVLGDTVISRVIRNYEIGLWWLAKKLTGNEIIELGYGPDKKMITFSTAALAEYVTPEMLEQGVKTSAPKVWRAAHKNMLDSEPWIKQGLTANPFPGKVPAGFVQLMTYQDFCDEMVRMQHCIKNHAKGSIFRKESYCFKGAEVTIKFSVNEGELVIEDHKRFKNSEPLEEDIEVAKLFRLD